MIRIHLLLIFFVISTTSLSQKIPFINSGQVIDNAKASYDSGNYAAAIRQFLTVPDRDTNYVYMQSELALAYIANKENDKAIALCENALKKPSIYTAHLLRSKAIALDHKGDFEESVNVFTKAIEKYPFDFTLIYNLGITMYNHKDYEKAIDCFFNVLAINPFHPGSHYHLGKLSMDQGKKTHAMLSFGLYLGLNNKDNNRLVLLEKFLTNQSPDEGTVSIKTFNQFDRLDQIIKAKIALDKKYKTKVPVDAAIVKQYQLLFEQLAEIEVNPEDRWAKYYLPLYKKLQSNDALEPFTYHILTSVNNDQVQKWLKKNDKQLTPFYNIVNSTLNEIRGTITAPQSLGFNKPVQARYYNDNRLESLGDKDASEKHLGHWIFLHPNNEIMAEGNYDEKGNKKDTWKYYFKNGFLQSVENNETGETQLFYNNGTMQQKFSLINDSIQGEANVYYSCGALRDVLMFNKGKRHGTCKSLYSSGKIGTEYNYKDGKLEGEYTTYFENGNLQSKAFYKNGDLSGHYKEFYADGKIKSEGEYNQDKITGIWKYYHSNGKLERTGNFKDGLATGEWKYYNVRGELTEKRNFNDKDELDGTLSNFHHGKLYSTYTYKNDLLIKVAYYDQNGKPIGTFGNNDGTFSVKQYFPNGQLSSEGAYKKGKPHGLWKHYFHNGKTMGEYNYVDGELQGEATEFFKSGKKKYSFIYKDNELNGYFQEFYIHGQVKAEGWLQEGKKQQQWLYYHPDGTLQSDYYFLDDELTELGFDYTTTGKLSSIMNYQNGLILDTKEYNGKSEVRTIKSPDKIKIIYESKYTNGKLQSKAEVTCGLHSGIYTRWFPNGKIHYTYNFMNGEKNGPYEYHAINDQIIVSGEFLNGSEQGQWKSYNVFGQLDYEGWYLDGESDSTWTFYYPNGKRLSKIEYLGDKRNGLTQNYSPDGNLILERIYDQGEIISYRILTSEDKLGDWIDFKGNETITVRYKDGSIAWEETYKDGMPEGTSRTYYPNGQLYSEYHYTSGDFDGPYAIYYANGKFMEKGTYKFDEVNGVKETYNEDGSLHKSENFIFGSRNGKSTLYIKGSKPKEYNFWGGVIDE